MYLPHELVNADRRDDRLGMVLNAVEDRNFTLGYLTYGAATRLTMPATEELRVTSQTGSVMPAAMTGSVWARAGTPKHKSSRTTRLDFAFIRS